MSIEDEKCRFKESINDFDPNKGVTLNYRYVSAWNEVNTRIQKRQDAILIYLSGIGVATGIIAKSDTLKYVDSVIWLIPVMTFLFIFLTLKHEFTIGNLRSFLLQCEKYTFINYKQKGMPAYHLKDTFFKDATFYRLWHDISCVILMWSCNGIALSLLYIVHKDNILQDIFGQFIVITILAAVLPLIFIFMVWCFYRNKFTIEKEIRDKLEENEK